MPAIHNPPLQLRLPERKSHKSCNQSIAPESPLPLPFTFSEFSIQPDSERLSFASTVARRMHRKAHCSYVLSHVSFSVSQPRFFRCKKLVICSMRSTNTNLLLSFFHTSTPKLCAYDTRSSYSFGPRNSFIKYPLVVSTLSPSYSQSRIWSMTVGGK